MPVGMEIKDYIQRSGRTQAYLSKKTGIPAPKLNLALNGRRKISLEEYEHICWALDVNTDKFLTPRKPKDERPT